MRWSILVIFVLSALGACTDTNDLETASTVINMDTTNEAILTPKPTTTPTPKPTATPAPKPTTTPAPKPTTTPKEDMYLDVKFTDESNIYLNLNIPEGFLLEELIVDKYEGHDKIAFFAIQEGTTYTAGDDIFQMVSWGHFGPSSGNILFYSDNLESEKKVPVTLNSGPYSIRFAQNNFNEAEYFLVGKLVAIP
jgi:hypothetical protein